MDNIRVAAIQMRAKVGAVATNLSHAESLVREAFRRGDEKTGQVRIYLDRRTGACTIALWPGGLDAQTPVTSTPC
jgi:hypothetical protein